MVREHHRHTHAQKDATPFHALCLISPPFSLSLPPLPPFLPLVLLSRELYGLKEEYELRDFQDQLRIQTGAIKAHGLGVQSTTTTTNQTIARTSGVAPPVTTTKYLQRGYDEREVGAAASSYGGGIGGGVGPQSHRAFTGVIHQPPPSSASYGGGAPLRDISQDIAAVRALQEQDRILTQAYSSRY